MKLFLDIDALADSLSVSTATIKRMVAQNNFPKPRELSGRRVGWLVREVTEWAEARPPSRMLPPERSAATRAAADPDFSRVKPKYRAPAKTD